jgi:hypothetical protein
MSLLDWCSLNGIRVHANVRIIHHEKKGVCVRAANYPIMSGQSRKLYTQRAIFAAVFR